MTRLRPPMRLLFVVVLCAGGLVAGCTDPCNNECPAGTVCDATLLACVPAGADGGPNLVCTTDLDCTQVGAGRCDLDDGVCVACLQNADCAGDEKCDLNTLSCVSGSCDSAADCAGKLGTPFCSAAGACVECLTAADCQTPGGVHRSCDLTLNRCVASPCTADSDCAVDPSGRRCDTFSGACVACLSNADCSADAPICDPTAEKCVGCTVDTDCPADEACNLSTQVCETPGCSTDADCAPGRCDGTSHSCVGCLTQSDCVFGGVCANEQCTESPTCSTDAECVYPDRCTGGECNGCGSDSDCPSGLACAGGHCVEQTSCSIPTACLSGRTCVNGVCAAAECTNDAAEPNDSAARATPTTPGHVDAMLCPNDEDDYLLSLTPGAGAEATVTFDPAGPTPKLELVEGPPGLAAPVEGTVTSPGHLAATISSAPSGTRSVLARVFGSDGVTNVAYALDTRVDAGGLCDDDAREPDDANNEAPVVQPGSFDGVVCPSNLDWFAFDVPEDSRLVTSLVLAGAATGSATVELYSIQNGALHRDAYGFTQATDPFVAPAGGQRFWVLVRNLTSQRFTYTLDVAEQPKPPENDACGEAAALPLDASTTGKTRGASVDGDASCGGTGGDVFYALTLAQPSELHLDLASDSPAALELQSSCDASTRLDCASSGGTSEHLSYEALPAGSYVVRVQTLTPGEEGAFTLSVRESAAEAAPTNESCDSATPLVPANGVASATGNVALAADDVTAACGNAGGDAVYALSLDAAAHVKVTLDAFAGASVSLVSADDCATESNAVCAVATTVSTGAEATIDRSALAAGDWRIVVDGGSARAGHFSLKVELSDAVFPPPNDACEGVLDLTGTATGDTRGGADDFTPACGVDQAAADEVYRLSLDADSEVKLQLTAAYDAALALTAGPCGSGAPVACANGPNARLDLADVPAGDYFVWVDGYSTGAGPFTLDATVGPALLVPANDACQDAEVVDLSSGSASVDGHTLSATDDLHPACLPSSALTGPDVVYAVDVPAGKSLHAVLDPADFDGALYALPACDANSCLAASDGAFVAGGEETIDVPNASADTVRVLVVVDSYTAAASGAFSLSFELR